MAEHRAWRLLRALLPSDFARRYADDVFETHVARARRRGTGPFRFWIDVTVDVLVTATQMRLQSLKVQVPRFSREDMDVRYAIVSLSRARVFSTTVIVALGLGIAATATLFTLTDRLLLRPAEHLERPNELRRVFIYGMSIFMRERAYMQALSYPDYVDLEKTRGFTSLAAYAPRSITVGEPGRSQAAKIEMASASYFPTLGVRPLHGRFFIAADDQVGAPLVAVLSHAYWRSHFGGDERAIGQTLRIGKGVYTIVGIAPPGFSGVDVARVDAWLPFRAANGIEAGSGWTTARNWYWFAAVARLDTTAPVRVAAQATLEYRRGRQSVNGNDSTAEVVLASVIDGRGPRPSDEAKVAPALTALALMVLLLSCANVANLVLTRGIQRRRAFAIQTAIGLSRRRLVIQSLAEVAILASIGGVLALAITMVATPLLFQTLLPNATVPQGLSLRLAAVMVAIVGITALVAGLVPALRSTNVDAFEALRFTRESRRGASARQGLLFAQALLCTLLLAGAGMFVKSLERARHRDLGVDTASLAVQMELMDGSRFSTSVATASYAPLERIRALPGVAAAGVTSIPPFYGNWGITLRTDRDTVPDGATGPFYYGAGGGFFEAIGLRVLQGRALTDADDRVGAARVAVVNQSLARLAFGSVNPVGRCLYVEKSKACTQVVGVVEDVLASIRADRPNQVAYLPPHHADIDLAAGTLIVRASGNLTSIIDEIRRATIESRSDIRMVDVKPIGTFLDAQLRSWKLGATLLTTFAALAVLVAVAGIFSALSFEVAQRRFELAVRSALGASAGALIRTSTARALIMCGSGALVGLAVAALASSRLERLLFQVSPMEPGVYGPVSVLMLVAIMLAAAIPAWRALRADPRSALQAE